jgi:hypothetical protein
LLPGTRSILSSIYLFGGRPDGRSSWKMSL